MRRLTLLWRGDVFGWGWDRIRLGRGAWFVRVAVAVCVAASLAAWMGGCASDPSKGYSFGEVYDDSVRTVAVPIFENQTFSTGVETQLTDAVVKRIQGSTPWKVTDQARADTVLVGVVTRVRTQTLSSQDLGFVQEQAVSISVDFTWRDNRTGDALVSRRNFSAASTFIASRATSGEIGERPEIGERDVIDELANKIVDQLRTRW